MVVNQLLKYGEFGIVLFDNFQVTERTRNQFVRKHTRVRIPLSPPKSEKHPQSRVLSCFFVRTQTGIRTDIQAKTDTFIQNRRNKFAL